MSTTHHHTARCARRSLVVILFFATAFWATSLGTGRTANAAPTSGCSAGRTLFSSTQATAHESRAVHALRVPTVSTHSYNWPLKPFDRQHPVRAFFNDPRVASGGSSAFHFGIDIAAPDGTPVYAVKAGYVYFSSAQSIAVAAPSRAYVFGYWHVQPVVRPHEFVKQHQLLGVIGRGWGHVHFAEKRDGKYMNPLRPGALGPYADATAPTISAVTVERGAGGTLALVADAHDTTIPRIEGPWADEPVTPALLEWRIVRAGKPARWITAVDFRGEMLSAKIFHTIYAPGTQQNHQGMPGRYCFYLARKWKAGRGAYHLQVRASDMRGNASVLDVPMTVAKGAIV
jgi:hypothetical protein